MKKLGIAFLIGIFTLTSVSALSLSPEAAKQLSAADFLAEQ